MFDDPRGESEALWKEMAQLGWLGLSLPEEHGGSGLGMVETAILLDELGRAAYPGPYLPTMLAGHAIRAAGSAAQKNRWLPAIAGDAGPPWPSEPSWTGTRGTTRAERAAPAGSDRAQAVRSRGRRRARARPRARSS
jgi:alkylation response protein AidB-like acyl-CoA dehydrogenase